MIKLVYILSPSHSGSTVLGLLLGDHPQIATVGELKMASDGYRDDATCSCNRAMNHCPFWREAARRLRAKGLDLTADSFHTHVGKRRTPFERLLALQVGPPVVEAARSLILQAWPGWRRALSHRIACNESMMETILEMTGRPVFLDTSKDASRLRYLVDSGRFDVSVIYLVRDGRAVACSMMRKGLCARAAAQYWINEHREARRLHDRITTRVRWRQLHYEALCQDPDATVESLCRFIGVPPEQRSLDFSSWDSHILGNRMRLSGVREITLDTSWRERLTGTDLATVQAITTDLNKRFGYPESAPPPDWEPTTDGRGTSLSGERR